MPLNNKKVEKKQERIEGMETKICNKCNMVLEISEFYKDKSRKDGLYSICKECTRNIQKQYNEQNKKRISDARKKYYIDNKEEIKKKRKEYALLYPEKIKANTKKTYENNKYKKMNYIKEWQKNNPEKTHLYKLKWVEENHEKIKLKNKKYISIPEIREYLNCKQHIRRAKLLNLDATMTRSNWKEAKEYFNNSCAYCGIETKLTKDHFIPVARDGGYTKNNIIPACKKCNCSKSAKDFFEWYPQQKFYSKEKEIKILDYLNSTEVTNE